MTEKEEEKDKLIKLSDLLLRTICGCHF